MSGRPQQILDLDPPTELVFKGPFSGVVTTNLTLRNPSNDKVGFKVKTTAPKQYCVRPNSGIVEPHSEAVVSVMLQPSEASSEQERSKHKFMVQSLCLVDHISLDELDVIMKSAGKQKLMDSKLKCVFETEEDGQKQSVTSSKEESTVSSVTQAGKSNSPSNSETASLNTAEETVASSSQPTAGSTPSHTSTSQPFQKEQSESELRMLREKVRTIADENKSLKSEAERLKQQFLTRTTTVSKQRPDDKKNQSLSIVAVMLILVAVVLGYFVGAYTS